MKKKSKKIAYPLVFSLLLSGCSYHDGKFTCFDLTDDNSKSLAHRQAAEKFWASVRPKTNLSEAHYRLGLHYQQIGEYDKAIGEFNKALRNDRGYCKAYNGIAMTHDLRKRCEDAHAAYEKAVECAPEAAYAYNNYACSSFLCGDYGKGLELLRKAELLAAGDTRIKNNLRIAGAVSIRDNLSEYYTTAEPPLPAAKKQPQPAPPLPVREIIPEVPAPQAPEVPAPAENSDNPVALAMDMNGKAAGKQMLAIPGVPESPVRQAAPAPPEAIAAINPLVEADEPTPAAILPIPLEIEVSNGNGTTGMAKRSAEFLRGRGFTVRSITNARHFRFEESVIYYKEEYLQAAKELAAIIPGTPNLERVGTLEKPFIGVKVLLARDLAALRFPESHAGSGDDRQTEKFRSEVITASNIQVRYR